jgi:hypothetical protein
MSNIEFKNKVNAEYTKLYWIIYNNVKKNNRNMSTKQLHVITKRYALAKLDDIKENVRKEYENECN